MNYNINTNQAIPCPYCRHFPVRCRTRSLGTLNEKKLIEHQWICSRCQNVARTDREQHPAN